jgi:hypothetical protein
LYTFVKKLEKLVALVRKFHSFTFLLATLVVVIFIFEGRGLLLLRTTEIVLVGLWLRLFFLLVIECLLILQLQGGKTSSLLVMLEFLSGSRGKSALD